jgi:hypothetical protein
MPIQSRDDLPIVFFPRPASRRNHNGLESALARSCNSRRIGFVGDDYSNPRVRNVPCVNAVCNRDEVRPASGEENA